MDVYLKSVDEFQAALTAKDKQIAELETELSEWKQINKKRAEKGLDLTIQTVLAQSGEHLLKIENEKLTTQLAKYKAALEEIAKDFGTDYCDGNTMIAHAALAEGDGSGEK